MLLSIITINYNDKEGLQKTINSIVSQTTHDYEWIIVDGGSKDGSTVLIEQYQSYITWWCSEPDKGIYNAMNKGIAHAHGEYCLFLNSGDYLFNEHVLEEIMQQEYTDDLVYGYMVDNVTGKRKDNFQGENITLSDFYISSFPHQATLIKRDLFTKYGGYDEKYKIVSDWKYFLELVVMHDATIKYLNKPVAYFDGTGVSSCAEPGSESTLVFQELFPKSILADYSNFISVKEVLANKLTRILYSLLYRLAVVINKNR